MTDVGTARPVRPEAARRVGWGASGLFLVVMALPACVRAPCPTQDAAPWQAAAHVGVGVSDPVQAERDEIFTLAAMSVAHRDWQVGTGPATRGYNIGAVLVDPQGRLVDWGRNANRRTGNGTQHAEVRMLQSYLATSRSYHLEGHTVYTTLEPCAQCAGMMVLAKVRRVVYALADPDYGAALERLALDSRERGAARGHAPYPRAVQSERADFPIARTLQRDAAGALASPEPPTLVAWLASDAAKRSFSVAADRLRTLEPVHAENAAAVLQAREFVEEVPAHWVQRFPWDPPAPE